MQLTVTFGRESKVVTLDSAATPLLVELKRAVCSAFGVLQSRQKLLFKGKDLSKETTKLAGAVGLKSGSKVRVTLVQESPPPGVAGVVPERDCGGPGGNGETGDALGNATHGCDHGPRP
jgi:hypothetical protein